MQHNNQAYIKTVKTKDNKPQREQQAQYKGIPKGKQWQRHDKAQQWQTLQ